MTDNPYAAPESTSQVTPLTPAAAGIHAVAKDLRVLGWICIIPYGSMGAVSCCLLVYRSLESLINGAIRPPGIDLLPIVQVTFAYLGTAFSGWIALRVGRKLPMGNSRAYWAALLLSGLMFIAFPLAPMGIYCLLKLRKHWRAYCEQLKNMSSANG